MQPANPQAQTKAKSEDVWHVVERAAAKVPAWVFVRPEQAPAVPTGKHTVALTPTQAKPVK